MLADKEVMATVAVRDLNAAKRFYAGTLGLEPINEQDSEALTYRVGDSKLLVYRSQYAGTNRATAATWLIGDELEALVRQLSAKGISFEHYDLPGLTRRGDVHVAGALKVAWFKDPDGNIHSLTSG